MNTAVNRDLFIFLSFILLSFLEKVTSPLWRFKRLNNLRRKHKSPTFSTFTCVHGECQHLPVTAKPCLYFSELKENFLPAEDSKTIYNPERDETVIKELHTNRLISTYQLSYCANVGKKSLVIDPDNLEEDQFMVYFNNYYKNRTQAVPRPIYTGRRVFGYSRFQYYYTGKTTYQDTISKEAYKYFKKDYDEGKSRLFRKKQLAKHKKPEELKPSQEETKEPPKTSKENCQAKDKICGLCCEKFGDFSCPKPEQN